MTEERLKQNFKLSGFLGGPAQEIIRIHNLFCYDIPDTVNSTVAVLAS